MEKFVKMIKDKFGSPINLTYKYLEESPNFYICEVMTSIYKTYSPQPFILPKEDCVIVESISEIR